MATIVLDAGHGGTDPGSVHFGRRESDDNLRMALAVGNILRARGHNVIQTRTTDIFVPLAERANIANRARADQFVSFHRNGAYVATANGVENWIHTNADACTTTRAQIVQNRMVESSGMRNRGLHRGNFAVLRLTNMPAMLIELGFMSNPEDNRLFDANFNANATAIANGIEEGLRACGPNTPIPPTVTPPVTPPPITPPTQQRPLFGPSDMIREIQRTLNSRYGQTLTVDGIAGPLTRRAITRAYQAELNRMFNAGLVVDGVFGPLTRAATRLVRRGDRGNLVWVLQAALTARGFPTTPDGIFGPLTEASVRAFQSANRLSADGIAGPITFGALFRGD